MQMKHVIQFSGGAGSYASARRVYERGEGELVLLCADTRSEHEDWRAFVDECHASLPGSELVVLDQGVDWWDLADQQNFIPNPRVDICSRILKREPLRAWLEENCDPQDTVIHLGFDWLEEHRLNRARPHWEPWTIDAPMMWQPFMDKADALAMIAEAGITMPSAYQTGMPHNNCLKYGCCKGGMAYWKKVLEVYPDAYARSEQREQAFRERTGKDVAILKDRRGGTTTPLPLKEFRRRIEVAAEPQLFDPNDWGSCSCMIPQED
jgi:hypothetical protein